MRSARNRSLQVTKEDLSPAIGSRETVIEPGTTPVAGRRRAVRRTPPSTSGSTLDAWPRKPRPRGRSRLRRRGAAAASPSAPARPSARAARRTGPRAGTEAGRPRRVGADRRGPRGTSAARPGAHARSPASAAAQLAGRPRPRPGCAAHRERQRTRRVDEPPALADRPTAPRRRRRATLVPSRSDRQRRAASKYAAPHRRRSCRVRERPSDSTGSSSKATRSPHDPPGRSAPAGGVLPRGLPPRLPGWAQRPPAPRSSALQRG